MQAIAAIDAEKGEKNERQEMKVFSQPPTMLCYSLH
jgi:hypothetical protein